MRRKGLAMLGAAMMLAGWTTSAVALDDQYGRSGPYLGFNGMFAFEDFSGAAGSPSPDGSWGYDIDAGYRFNEYFALQAGWQQMVGFDDSTGDTSIWMVGLDGKFYPFHGIVQPYALVGVGWADVDDERAASKRSSSGLAARFGGGIEFYVHRNWAITTEIGYVLQTSGRDDYGSIPLSFGILYRFY